MLKWLKPLKTTAKMCIVMAVIVVQTNIYCRHSAAATYLCICILYIIYFRAVVGISAVEWQIFMDA
jgi:hypothetical protein